MNRIWVCHAYYNLPRTLRLEQKEQRPFVFGETEYREQEPVCGVARLPQIAALYDYKAVRPQRAHIVQTHHRRFPLPGCDLSWHRQTGARLTSLLTHVRRSLDTGVTPWLRP
jgi:hypothetical protein